MSGRTKQRRTKWLMCAVLVGAWSISPVALAGHVEDLQAAAKKRDLDPDQALQLGRQLLLAGLPSDAIQAVRSGYAKARGVELVSAMRLTVARAYVGLGDTKHAQRECELMEKLDRAAMHLCRAETLLALRRASLALPEADAALAKRPGDYESLVVRARALQQGGQIDEAKVAFALAIAKDPSNALAHRHEAALYLKVGQNAEATRALRATLAAEAHDAEARVELARLVGGDEARTLLREATGLRHRYAEAHAELGSLELAQGNFAEAEASLRMALGIQPIAAWHVMLAEVLLRKGDADAALGQAAAASKIVKNHAGAKLVEAEALAAKGDIDLAITAFEAAHGLARREPTALVRGAIASLAGGRPSTALAFADLATQEFGDWSPAWEALGDTNVVLGDSGGARSAYKKALVSRGVVNKPALERKLAAVK